MEIDGDYATDDQVYAANDGIYAENEVFCAENDGGYAENDGFYAEHDGLLLLKMMDFVLLVGVQVPRAGGMQSARAHRGEMVRSQGPGVEQI